MSIILLAVLGFVAVAAAGFALVPSFGTSNRAGKRIKAQEALDMGLVNEVVPRAGLDAAVQHWVDDLLACAPLSQQAIKQVVRLTATMSPAQAQATRLPAVVAALQSDDASEGVLAFQQKRKPQWTGR